MIEKLPEWPPANVLPPDDPPRPPYRHRAPGRTPTEDEILQVAQLRARLAREEQP